MISKKGDIRLILDNIRSVHNVGSIFRTAEAIGVSKIYCVGTTATPLDRFGRKRRDLAKVALGAEENIPFEHMTDADALIESLKKEGFTIIALEQNTKSVDYKKVSPTNKTLVIIGNEVNGVNEQLLKKADIIAEIPMEGKKESLNASVSAGILLFRLFDR